MKPLFVTGVGSWPGEDILQACQMSADFSDGLPYLPELPQRGYGADLIGRAMALVAKVDSTFAVRTTPTGWQLDSAIGRETRRAESFLDRDLDAVEEVFDQYEGDFKVQIAGPWTLASSVELLSGQKMLSDAGAVRELAAALVQAISIHVQDLAHRLARATIVVQIDEPMMPMVICGQVPTASGWQKYRAIEIPIVHSALENIFSALPNHHGIVHDCSDEVNFTAMSIPGIGWSIDATKIGDSHFDAIGQHIDKGGFLVLGIDSDNVSQGVSRIKNLGSAIGFSQQDWNSHIGLSPSCGLSGMGLSQARARMEVLSQIARALSEES